MVEGVRKNKAGSHWSPYFHSPNLAAQSQSLNVAKAAHPLPYPAPFQSLGLIQACGHPLQRLPSVQSWFLPPLPDPHISLLVSPDPAWIPRLDCPADHPPRTPTLVSPASPAHARGGISRHAPSPTPPIPGWSRPPGGPGSESCGGYGTDARCVPVASGSPLGLAAAALPRAPGARWHRQLQLRPQPPDSAGAGEERTHRPPSWETRRLLGPASRGGAA